MVPLGEDRELIQIWRDGCFLSTHRCVERVIPRAAATVRSLNILVSRLCSRAIITSALRPEETSHRSLHRRLLTTSLPYHFITSRVLGRRVAPKGKMVEESVYKSQGVDSGPSGLSMREQVDTSFLWRTAGMKKT
jgi:hypothetical protein